MTFQDSITTCFKKYAEFTGRAGRPEFWWFALFTFLVSVAIDIVLPGSAYTLVDGAPLLTWWNSPAEGVQNLWSLATLLPSLAVTVRRLRDAGRHWGNVFWILLPIIGWIILIVQLAQPGVPARQYPGYPAQGYNGAGPAGYGNGPKGY
ncbi:MAG: DUF805 domain-containing protein [Arthrobacter sp.]|jgi:uncharacterized membrane protein YhaH (DUF805 family)|nr:DUF805 domain-containing protein [Arthrobacter sp.]